VSFHAAATFGTGRDVAVLKPPEGRVTSALAPTRRPVFDRGASAGAGSKYKRPTCRLSGSRLTPRCYMGP